MSSNEIKFGKLKVKEAFEKWFRIPNYQRPYVWEKDQVIDLLDDISEATKKDKNAQFFLGNLVLKENFHNGYEEFDILDGQQRLTTLFLITAVIRDITDNKQRKETCQKSIFQEGNDDDKIPERVRLVFDIRDEVRKFIEDYIKQENKTYSEDIIKKSEDKSIDPTIYNMARAILAIQEYFDKNNNIDDFFPFLRNNVILTYVSSKSLDDAFKVFTILNNRGVKLRSSDILKAENLGCIKDKSKQNEKAQSWDKIEKYFGEHFDEFLSHLQRILVKDKSRKSLLKEFEDNIFNKGLLLKGENFFNYIDKYFSHYKELFDNSSQNVRDLLSLMKIGFESDIWISPLLKYYDKFKEYELFKFIEKLNNKFSSDWITGLTPSTRIANMNEIIRKIELYSDAVELFDDECFKINKDEMRKFIEGDLYGKRGGRYMLLRLNYLYNNSNNTEFTIPRTISVEHIMPQNPNTGSEWLSNFTDEERKNWVNKIGNLIIISRRKNSSQSNLDFKIKKEKYFKDSVELGRSSAIMSKYNDWTLEELQDNHNESIAKLKKSYQIEIKEEVSN